MQQADTSARKYGEIEPVARDLIAVMEQVDVDSFGLAVDVELAREAAGFLEAAERARREAAERNADAAADVRTAVALLLEQGLSQQEVADVLGVNKQRASKLAAEGRKQLSATRARCA